MYVTGVKDRFCELQMTRLVEEVTESTLLRCHTPFDIIHTQPTEMGMCTRWQVAIALYAVDTEKDKMMMYTGVPPTVAGIDCVAWMKAGVEPISGKGGGGKGGIAQGQGSGAGKLSECEAAALEFAKLALN